MRQTEKGGGARDAGRRSSGLRDNAKAAQPGNRDILMYIKYYKELISYPDYEVIYLA